MPDSKVYMKTLIMFNKMEEVEHLESFVEQICEDLNLDMKLQSQLNLALEEAVVNVINYAYPAGKDGKIRLHVSSNGVEICFTLSDAGQPFDPTLVPEADTTQSVEERPIGGLGIFLIRKIMNEVSYRYKDNQNELTMIKNINIQ